MITIASLLAAAKKLFAGAAKPGKSRELLGIAGFLVLLVVVRTCAPERGRVSSTVDSKVVVEEKFGPGGQLASRTTTSSSSTRYEGPSPIADSELAGGSYPLSVFIGAADDGFTAGPRWTVVPRLALPLVPDLRLTVEAGPRFGDELGFEARLDVEVLRR